ncbi:MAG: hypothetical protein J6Z42_07075, partial [Lachnospiraceae bacterium]|nr:hypothetical protein [Lachnospiraceae bacterium]
MKGVLMEVSAKLKEIMKEIVIPGADAIRGNITLPLKIKDATVSWKSSAPDVITDRAVGRIAAGVVTRGSFDRDVLLTATVSLDGESAVKDIIVHVLKSPTKIKDEDYTAYLFGHFIGEEGEDGEQIYFAVSEEGLNFKDMNGGQPILTSNV